MTTAARATGLLLGTLVACAAAGAGDESVAQLLKDAATEVGFINFEGGYNLFSKAAALAPEKSEAWQQAVFGQALCAHHLSPATESRIKEAERWYKELAEKCPRSKYTPWALLSIGRIYELNDFYTGDQMDLEGARPWYQKVIDGWPEDPIAGEATLRLASTWIQTMKKEDVERGSKLLEDWLARHPQEALASAMWQYLGDSYFYPLDNAAASLECYVKADGLGFIERGREGPVLWRMAVLAERLLDQAKQANQPEQLGRYRDWAVRYYTRVITRTPNSGKAWQAQQRLKALGAPVPEIRLFTTGGAAAATQPSPGGQP